MAENKTISTTRGPGAAPVADPARTELQDACNIPVGATLAGKFYEITPLDLNDLAELDAVTGGMEFLDVSKVTHQRAVLWLAMRKADPSLTPEERERGYYKLTEFQVGKMFTLRNITQEEVATFIEKVLTLTGLIGDPVDPKNQAEDHEVAQTAPTPGDSAT